MSEPTLSVLLPNYNHSQYLPQALEAIATQSRPPDEFIIIDDCSTDNSVAIVEEWAARYPFIRLIRHERNQGVVKTLEHLLAECRGEYVHPSAADDFVLPGFYETALNLAHQHPQAGVLFGEVLAREESGQELFRASVAGWTEPLYADPERYYRECLSVTPNVHFFVHAAIHRRAALAEVGDFREDLGLWGDNFALRASALKYGACYVPFPCGVYRAMTEGFAASSGRNPVAMLELSHRVAALMRSEQFRDRFPEEHITGWQQNFERWAFDSYVFGLRQKRGFSGLGKWQGRALRQYLNLVLKVRYRGDAAAMLRDRAGRS